MTRFKQYTINIPVLESMLRTKRIFFMLNTVTICFIRNLIILLFMTCPAIYSIQLYYCIFRAVFSTLVHLVTCYIGHYWLHYVTNISCIFGNCTWHRWVAIWYNQTWYLIVVVYTLTSKYHPLLCHCQKDKNDKNWRKRMPLSSWATRKEASRLRILCRRVPVDN